MVCCCSKTAQLPTTKIPLNLFVTTSYHLVHQISIYWQSFKSANNFSIFIISLCSTIYCLRTGNRFSTIMAPYNYEPVSIIYGFSLPQFPEAFTQTHIYFMTLHDIPKNVSTETPIYFARFPTLPKLYYSYFHSQPIVLIPKSLLPPVTTLTVAESPSPGLNCELPQNIITSHQRVVTWKKL